MLEDRQGSVEVLVFPETFGKCSALVENGTLVLVRGKLERDEEELRLLSSDILPIGTLRERLARELSITLPVPPHGRTTFEALFDLFDQYRGDKPVTVQLEIRNGETPMRVHAQISSQIRVRPSAVFLAEVQKLCGEGSVALK
jgi:DNA polymerase-3 subunit alpha